MTSIALAKKLIALVFGSTLLAIGFALLFLPGPGTVVLGIGLAVLATEFWWARWLLHRAKAYSYQMYDAARNHYDRFRGSAGESNE